MGKRMETEICGVKLKNPVIAASGTFAFGREFEPYLSLAQLGGISLKGLTLEPRQGNPSPRVAETPSGMLNSVGLQNPGLEAFLREDMPRLEQAGTALIANVAGSTTEDYVAMAQGLQNAKIDIFEMNVSCPNVKEGCVGFGATPEAVYAITRAVKPHCKQPLMVKLTPNTVDIAANARAAEEGGADAVSLINTLTGMAVDVDTRRPILANITGGLSGPAVKPVALRMVWQVAQAVKIPVVGMGGIMTGEDAVEFLLCGAAAVMVGTANLVYPDACLRVLQGMEAYMERHGIHTVGELVGQLKI